MAPATPPKRGRAATDSNGSSSLPTPPKTPSHRRGSERVNAGYDSKASRALARLRDKLRQRSGTVASPSSRHSGQLLPAHEINTPVSPSRPSKRQKTDGPVGSKDRTSRPLIDGEVIEISSDDNAKGVTSAGDDKSFRGRQSRSRVQSSSASQPPPPLRTRGFFKRTGATLEDNRAEHQEGVAQSDRDVTPVISDTDEELALEPYEALTRTRKKNTVQSESEDFSAGEYDSDDSFIDDRAMVNEEHASNVDEASNGYPSDEESQLQLAMIQSVVTAMSPNLPKDKYEKAVHDAATALFKSNAEDRKKKKKRSKKKGKGKAKVTDIDDDMHGLSSGGENLESGPLHRQQSLSQHGGPGDQHSTAGSSTLPGIAPPAGTGSAIAATPAPPVTMGSLVSNATSSNVTPSSGAAMAPPVTAVAPGQHVTLASLVASVPGAATQEANVKYVRRVESLPDVNGVHLPDQQEPILAGDYAALCNLVSGSFKPWMTTRGRPRTPLSHFGKTMPNMSATLALAIIRFQSVGQYINPSRISPLEVELKEYPSDPRRYHLVRNRRPAYCVMFGAVSRCQLQSRSSAGLKQRFINVRGVPVESERQESWFCMVTGHDPLPAQYGLNSLQMSTKSDFTKADGKTTPISTDEWTIDSDDQVPIYDARAAPGFDFLADVANIDTRLPRWAAGAGEIPRESCVAVAYSVSLFYSNTSQEWTLGCNVRWVLVLGVPGST